MAHPVLEKYNGKDYFTICEIHEDDCVYIIKQPVNKPTSEEITDYYSFISDLLYSKLKRDIQNHN